MFQVIHPPYKKVTLACIACLCFEIGVCPWPDLSSLFQYTGPTPVVLLHLIPKIQYHPGIPVTLLTGSSYRWKGTESERKRSRKTFTEDSWLTRTGTYFALQGILTGLAPYTSALQDRYCVSSSPGPTTDKCSSHTLHHGQCPCLRKFNLWEKL